MLGEDISDELPYNDYYEYYGCTKLKLRPAEKLSIGRTTGSLGSASLVA